MSDGHCRHCGTGCTGGTDLGDGPNLHTDMAFAFWRDGRCPACAEAERIAEAIDAKRAHPINEGKDAYDIRYALTDAARIARGLT